MSTDTQNQPTPIPDWQPPLPPEDFIFDDGETLESNRYHLAMNALIRSVNQAFANRSDFLASGKMFIDYSLEPVKNRDFRGPDCFVVLDIDGSYPCQGWMVWQERGPYPDIIVELRSERTTDSDVTVKKNLYERTFKTPDYFVDNPFDEFRQSLPRTLL